MKNERISTNSIASTTIVPIIKPVHIEELLKLTHAYGEVPSRVSGSRKIAESLDTAKDCLAIPVEIR